MGQALIATNEVNSLIKDITVTRIVFMFTMTGTGGSKRKTGPGILPVRLLVPPHLT